MCAVSGYPVRSRLPFSCSILQRIRSPADAPAVETPCEEISVATPLSNLPEYSVSEISQAIKRTMEDTFGQVRLRGEISGFRGPHSSGHCYFALKDQNAKIDAIVWRGSYGRLRQWMEEGLEVIATGKVTTYPAKSGYQIVIEAIEPAGQGALLAQLEERRKKLAAEGLFDAERKRPLPYLPRAVGVVTSPTGAVIRDILHRMADRFPVRVLVWPARVQGDGAAEEVARGIAGLNALPEVGSDGKPLRPDVVIVARGGGSLEDLWAFNEEVVVRAAAASAIPLISAVGHETDTTLIDFASDVRAPTPTAAAEIALPVRAELLASVEDLGARQRRGLLRLLEHRRVALKGAARGLPRLEDVLAIPRQRLDTAAAQLPVSMRRLLRDRAQAVTMLARSLPRLDHLMQLPARRLGELSTRLGRAQSVHVRQQRQGFAAVSARLSPLSMRRAIERGNERVSNAALRFARVAARDTERRRTRLDRAAGLLATLSHRATLERGFALVRDLSGNLVRATGDARAAKRIAVEFADGSIVADVADGAPPSSGSRPAPARKGKSGGGQGSLFD
ncbi:MAG: exodeoxyribonuclease VII large subunit [Rhodobiaceae bacterium]|nr:exodeoxyribonuclease VII large subunit [Rhodobiaceae bacterium]MCC0040672.1 exodeoxyribonuclease VII large subunit [Rhodobiaceae bacterium]